MPYAFVANATVCTKHKQDPVVNFSSPEWRKTIQSTDLKGSAHGQVFANLSEKHMLSMEIVPVVGGACVVLLGVDSSFGFTEFIVQMDKKYKIKTCEYDVIMNHEDQHILANLSVMDDLAGDMKNAIQVATKSIIPIFIKDGDIDRAAHQIERTIQTHPMVVLAKQKIAAEQELRNRQIDRRDDSAALRNCKK